MPFFHRAKEEGVQFASYRGGKEDDITVLVGIVNEESVMIENGYYFGFPHTGRKPILIHRKNHTLF